MPHDKIRAAARKRMAQTGEPYTAARRAVVSEHQGAGAGDPPPGAGYALRMSGEIHDWLTDLRRSDQSAALRFVAFIDRVYDAQLPIRATGTSLDLVFPEEMLAGGYRKKYLRAISRLIALTTGTGV